MCHLLDIPKLTKKVIDTYHWKYGTLNLYSMLGFRHKCTDRPKPNVEIKMTSPYHSVQMSTQHQIWLQCMCWQKTLPNRYIEVEFDVGYLQWQGLKIACLFHFFNSAFDFSFGLFWSFSLQIQVFATFVPFSKFVTSPPNSHSHILPMFNLSSPPFRRPTS